MSTAVETIGAAPREDLSKGFLWAAVLHGGIALLVAVWGWFGPEAFQFGSPTGGDGSAVLITPVANVPIVRRPSRFENPVANPVRHEVPALPDPEPVALTPPETPEIEIPDEREVRKPKAKNQPKVKEQRTAKDKTQNQLNSSTGAQAQAEMLDSSRDQGVGFGTSGRDTFGLGYQWYAEAIQRKISGQWRQMMGQVRGRSRREAIVTFRISRTGTVDRVKLAQSSGNRTLDFTAMRAVQRASPLPRLPRQLPKNTVTVELWFQLESRR